VEYVAPVHQRKVKRGVHQPLIYIIRSAADSRIGLELFGQVPYSGAVTYDYFDLCC